MDTTTAYSHSKAIWSLNSISLKINALYIFMNHNEQLLKITDHDHTDPLFSKLKLLKLADIFNLQQLKFYYKYIKGDLPEYFKSLNFVPNSNYHNYDTRHRNQLHIGITKKAFTKKCIRHSIPALINKTPSSITEKLSSHSLNGFSHYVKNYYISEYNIVCSIDNCYICNRQ